MGLFRKSRDETESSDGPKEDNRSGFEGNLHLTLPTLQDWNIEYHIDHESANFTADLSASFDSVWFSTDMNGEERKIPSYLLDWEGKRCNLMINSCSTTEDFARRKTDEQLGFGWRGPNDRFVLKIYLTRTEFRDVVQVLSQDHLRQGNAARELVLGWLEKRGIEPNEELDDAFVPSDAPRIRIDVKNARLVDPDNLVRAELLFDVSRIYA